MKFYLKKKLLIIVLTLLGIGASIRNSSSDETIIEMDNPIDPAKTVTIYSLNKLSESSAISIAVLSDNIGCSIQFIHTAQIVQSKDNAIFIVDHFSRRQDRLLMVKVEFDETLQKHNLHVWDLTDNLPFNPKDWADNVYMTIEKTDPLTINATIDLHDTSSKSEHHKYIIKNPEKEAKSKIQSLDGWILSSSLWSN